MSVDVIDIHSLSGFQCNTKQYVNDLKGSHRLVVVTINGDAVLVVQDAAAYQELLDELEIARSVKVMKQRVEQFAEDGIEFNSKEALGQLGKELGVRG